MKESKNTDAQDCLALLDKRLWDFELMYQRYTQRKEQVQTHCGLIDKAIKACIAPEMRDKIDDELFSKITEMSLWVHDCEDNKFLLEAIDEYKKTRREL